MPKWLMPALFACVGVPLILADAASTSGELSAVDQRAEASRASRCVDLATERGLSRAPAQSLCGCIVREAERRGIDGPHGSYDEARLPAVVSHCERTTGVESR